MDDRRSRFTGMTPCGDCLPNDVPPPAPATALPVAGYLYAVVALCPAILIATQHHDGSAPNRVAFATFLVGASIYLLGSRRLVALFACSVALAIALDYAPFVGQDPLSKWIRAYAEQRHPPSRPLDPRDFLDIAEYQVLQHLVRAEVAFVNSALQNVLLLLLFMTLAHASRRRRRLEASVDGRRAFGRVESSAEPPAVGTSRASR